MNKEGFLKVTQERLFKKAVHERCSDDVTAEALDHSLNRSSPLWLNIAMLQLSPNWDLNSAKNEDHS